MTLDIDKDLVPKIRNLIDEIAHDATEDFSSDLNAEIRQSVIYAAQKMKRNLGRQFLEPQRFDAVVSGSDDGTGTLTLPEDFGELVEMQMQGWLQPVTDLIESGSVEAKQQMHPWTRGSWCKPVAMMVLKEGANVIKYYCAKKEEDYIHVLDHLDYMPIIDDATEVLPIVDDMYDILTYQAAAILMLSKNETQAAEQFASMGTVQPHPADAATV